MGQRISQCAMGRPIRSRPPPTQKIPLLLSQARHQPNGSSKNSPQRPTELQPQNRESVSDQIKFRCVLGIHQRAPCPQVSESMVYPDHKKPPRPHEEIRQNAASARGLAIKLFLSPKKIPLRDGRRVQFKSRQRDEKSLWI